MFEQISIHLTAMILGIMLFFSFVIAPVVFSFLVLILFLFLNNLGIDFYIILSVTLLFATSNYLLMPLINKFRDEKQDKKFKYSHFVSVVINFVQMIFLVFILI